MGNGKWRMGNGEWGMGNGEWGMDNGEWGMGNGEWGMGNGEWGMGNLNFLIWNKFFSAAIIDIHVRYATFCARIKGYDNGVSHPEWLPHYLKLYLLLAGWSVRLVKNCDRGLENAALVLRPRAAFSSLRSWFFTLRTDPEPCLYAVNWLTSGGFAYATLSFNRLTRRLQNRFISTELLFVSCI